MKKAIFRKRRSNSPLGYNRTIALSTEKEEKKSIMFGLLMSVQSLLPLSLLNVLVVFNTEFKGFFWNAITYRSMSITYSL